MKPFLLLISLLYFTDFKASVAQTLHLFEDTTWVNIGDLDVAGNQITVEALMYKESNASLNIVSKHSNPGSVNYLLRPLTFELTTYITGNNGPTQFLQMFNPFTLDLNTWYHVAGTYDGTTVKYYVNGCLVIEKPFSGNLFQSDDSAIIGNQATCKCEQFYGKIDEVRIWNICRTQSQISNNMVDLPNPGAQAGLLAYYKFDGDFTNSEGNSFWDADTVGNVEFLPAIINIPTFEITGAVITNSDCNALHNGSITVSTNNTDCEFSIDGTTYQLSSFFPNLDAGTYTIYVKSPEGCVIDSTVTVPSNNISIPVDVSGAICQGETYLGHSSTGTFLDTLHALGTCDTIRTLHLTVHDTYSFNDEITLCPEATYDFHGTLISTEGTYEASYSTIFGCDSIYHLAASVAPATFLGNDTILCAAATYDLVSTSANTLWFDNTISKTKTINTTGWYWATLSDNNGCEITDSVNVQFNVKVFVPNAFTPNDDGLNDLFNPIFSAANFSFYDLLIFDRWGRQLFATNDPEAGWDGNYLEIPAEIGSYIYFLTFETGICGRTSVRGSVSLLK